MQLIVGLKGTGKTKTLIEEVNKVLFEDKSAKEAVFDLMIREKRVESNALDWK